jgi:hypothetical protein
MSIDLAPVSSWPRRMRRERATKYLREVHGIEFKPKTLANRNAAGKGPFPEYLGGVPYYTRLVLDEFAETAFTPTSPFTAEKRRLRQEPRTSGESDAALMEQPPADPSSAPRRRAP